MESHCGGHFDQVKKAALFKFLLHVVVHLCELTLTLGEAVKYSELCDTPNNDCTKHPDCGFTILRLKRLEPFGEMTGLGQREYKVSLEDII